MVKRLFYLIITYWVIHILPVKAQLMWSDTTRWSLKADAGLNFTGGNVARFVSQANAEIKYRKPSLGLSFKNSYIYGTLNNFLLENEYFGNGFVYLFPKNRIYPYWMIWLESSLRRRFDFRYQTGPGVSWELTRSSVYPLKLSLSFTREVTFFQPGVTLNDASYPAPEVGLWRVTLRLAGQIELPKPSVRFFYEFRLQNAIREIENFRYNLDCGGEIKLFHRLGFISRFRLTHEELVAIPLKKTDWFWTAGLSYEFRKVK